ncbi:MAG: hypothetical protein F4057_09875 [Acidobacteria bacterium]|nr:hypothetical protein [Acidobacteriota bacterium]
MGLLVLAAPASWEGPVLVDVAPGHAIALLDAAGIVPLVLGSTIVFQEFWRRRGQLAQSMSNRPGAGLGAVFAAGLGLGLLIASAFSGFFWWWAVGAALFACTVVAAAAATALWGG